MTTLPISIVQPRGGTETEPRLIYFARVFHEDHIEDFYTDTNDFIRVCTPLVISVDANSHDNYKSPPSACHFGNIRLVKPSRSKFLEHLYYALLYLRVQYDYFSTDIMIFDEVQLGCKLTTLHKKHMPESIIEFTLIESGIDPFEFKYTIQMCQPCGDKNDRAKVFQIMNALMRVSDSALYTDIIATNFK